MMHIKMYYHIDIKIHLIRDILTFFPSINNLVNRRSSPRALLMFSYVWHFQQTFVSEATVGLSLQVFSYLSLS